MQMHVNDDQLAKILTIFRIVPLIWLLRISETEQLSIIGFYWQSQFGSNCQYLYIFCTVFPHIKSFNSLLIANMNRWMCLIHLFVLLTELLAEFIWFTNTKHLNVIVYFLRFDLTLCHQLEKKQQRQHILWLWYASDWNANTTKTCKQAISFIVIGKFKWIVNSSWTQ